MKKKLLIVSYKIPYPLDKGGAIAQFFFLKNITSFFNVTFCTIVSNDNQAKNLEDLKRTFPEVAFRVYKAPDYIIKKTYIELIINRLEKISRKVALRLSKTFKSSKMNLNNLDRGVVFADEKFVLFFRNVLKNGDFDIIQLEFFETLALLPLIPDSIKKIVIQHEIRGKKNSLINSRNAFFKSYIEKIMSSIENSLLDMADTVVVFNNEDKNYLCGIKSKIKISPFGIPKSLIVKNEVSNHFNKFIFIGSEFHFPNKEGLEWFLDSIFIPHQETINWPIYITSNWSKGFRQKYKNNKQIIFTGHMHSLEEIYKNAILIAPIISGSGIRTKILEAFANKIPVMSTVFASEGLYDNKMTQKHLIHFESDLDFINQFNNIKDNLDLIINLANNSFKYFTDNFNENILLNKRLLVYKD